MFKSMPIKYSVFPKDENPLFSEFATHISIDDEAAGAYIVIEQFPDDGCQKIKLDLPELEELLRLANKLRASYDHVTKEEKYKIEMKYSEYGESIFRYVSLVDDVKGAWHPTEKGAEEDAEYYFKGKEK